MADQAQEAVITAKAAYSVDLDYTVESIQHVERILAATFDSKPRGLIARLLGRALTENEAARAARMYGSYVGETLIRQFGGHWEKDHPVAGRGSYPIMCRGNQSFPLGWCYRRLMNGPEDNVWHKTQAIYLSEREAVRELKLN